VADISDVEQAMVGMIAQFLGLGLNYLPGSAVSSAQAKQRCRVYRGWPISAALDQDLVAGISSVTVFPLAGATRRTTKYFPQWHPGVEVAAVLRATISGSSVTFDGIAAVGQIVGIRVGPPVGGSAYGYRLQPHDTLATVAAAFVALIVGSTSSANVLTLPSSLGLNVRIIADQPAWMETRRQAQHIWVIGWAPSPTARDTVMSLVDEGFANMMNSFGNLTYFMPLPDGSSADLRYYSSYTVDKTQQANLWRRDLRYVVEYPTTLLQTQPGVIFYGGSLEDSSGATNPISDTLPV
jgi:hypothetical protein